MAPHSAPPLSPQHDLLLQHGHDDWRKHQDGHRQNHTCQSCLQQGLRMGTGWGEWRARGWEDPLGKPIPPQVRGVCTAAQHIWQPGRARSLTAVLTELDPRQQPTLPHPPSKAFEKSRFSAGGRVAEGSHASLGCTGIRVGEMVHGGPKMLPKQSQNQLLGPAELGAPWPRDAVGSFLKTHPLKEEICKSFVSWLQVF